MRIGEEGKAISNWSCQVKQLLVKKQRGLGILVHRLSLKEIQLFVMASFIVYSKIIQTQKISLQQSVRLRSFHKKSYLFHINF